MNDQERKAMEMALEALLNYPMTEGKAIHALRQALAQPDWTTDTPVPPFKYLDLPEYKIAQPEQPNLQRAARHAREVLDYVDRFLIMNKVIREELVKDAIADLDKALAKPEQDHGFDRTASHMAGEYVDTAGGEPAVTEKDGSPCPEFWDWLPKAYNFEGLGEFTKYNMEVAFLAGKNTVLAQGEQTEYDKAFEKEFEQYAESDEGKARNKEAQSEQEPVAWIEGLEKPQPRCVTNLNYRSVAEAKAGVQFIPLYTSPQKREWQELTDEDWHNLPTSNKQGCERDAEIFNWIEDKLKEKNT